LTYVKKITDYLQFDFSTRQKILQWPIPNSRFFCLSVYMCVYICVYLCMYACVIYLCIIIFSYVPDFACVYVYVNVLWITRHFLWLIIISHSLIIQTNLWFLKKIGNYNVYFSYKFFLVIIKSTFYKIQTTVTRRANKE